MESYFYFLVSGILKRSFSASGGERQSQTRYVHIELLEIFLDCRIELLVAKLKPDRWKLLQTCGNRGYKSPP